MPYKGDGKEFSIRVSADLLKKIEKLFIDRDQSHLSKNAKVLTLIKESLSRNQVDQESGKKELENVQEQ